MVPTVHIYQGGTLNTYCRRPLSFAITVVSWDNAELSNCDDCLGSFISGPATPPLS